MTTIFMRAPAAMDIASRPATPEAPEESAAPAVQQVQTAATPAIAGSAYNVTNEAIAAIQQLSTLGTGRSPSGATAAEIDAREKQTADRGDRKTEFQSPQELQAEARRWERYYAHQPRRLADLLAVYYGGNQRSVDPRGPHPTSMIEELEGPES